MPGELPSKAAHLFHIETNYKKQPIRKHEYTNEN